MYIVTQPQFIGKLSIRNEIEVLPTDINQEKIDDIVAAIALQPLIKHMEGSHLRYRYDFSESIYSFLITNQGEIRLYSVGRRISPERVLDDNSAPKWVTRFIIHNLDLFTYKKPLLGFVISESIGIGIVNPKGITKLNVTTTK